MSVTETPVWAELSKHAEVLSGKKALELFTDDSNRLSKYDITFKSLRLNYTFQILNDEVLALLVDLAKQQNVEGWRARMFSGEKVNNSENRAVLHTALRRSSNNPLLVDGRDVMPGIRETQERIAHFVERVRNGAFKGATGKKIRHIVNIGIGGSDLGPRLIVEALHKFVSVVEPHFVANADIFELQNLTQRLDPEETLFVVVSKTFTTQETLLNAHSARLWITDKLGSEAVKHHFVAVSVNADDVNEFGIRAENMFPMWDWVGGRFSLWSAVGLSVALAIGNEHFQDLLSGAESLDEHFGSAPLASNMPVMLALLGIWNRNFRHCPALAILPYSERLRDLPRFLQQLDMESNGKSVSRDGTALNYDTGPALFGECGTVGQHSFHQWLHQGMTPIPADFIGVRGDDLQAPEHHRALLSNMAAQIGALAFGRLDAPSPQECSPGLRPSNLIMLEKIDPQSLGMLIALYEHKIFVQGVIWNINSFDQPGVELGKLMARGLTRSSELSRDVSPKGSLMHAFYKGL